MFKLLIKSNLEAEVGIGRLERRFQAKFTTFLP